MKELVDSIYHLAYPDAGDKYHYRDKSGHIFDWLCVFPNHTEMTVQALAAAWLDWETALYGRDPLAGLSINMA